MHRAVLVLLDLGVGKMRRQHGKLAPRRRHALRHGAGGVLARDHAGRQHAGEHVIARALGGAGKAIRTAHLGRLRNGDQQGRFAHRQPPRLLAEIGERRRAHAFQVAAERRQPEIEPQDLVLRQPPVELQRQQRLADLADQGFLVHAQQQPRHLHGDGRAARQRAPVAQQQPSGPPDRQRIDAVMAAEALVLEGDQHGEVARIDLLHLRRQAPAAVGRGVGAQQPVVAVEHRDGQRLGAGQRQRLQIGPRPRHQPGDTGQQGGACQHDPAKKAQRPAAATQTVHGKQRGAAPKPGCCSLHISLR